MVSQIYRPRYFNLAVSSSDGVVKAQELSALEEASAIIQSAQNKADEIIMAAQDHYEKEKERGYLEGRDAAEKEAFSRLMTEQIFLDNKLQELEMGLASVVMTSVRKIFAGFDDFALCKRAILSALQKLRQSSHIKISLPAALADELEPITDRLKAEIPEFQFMEFIEDASLSSPNFIVESSTGRIEFNLGDKLEELEAMINETVAARTPEGRDVDTDKAAA